MGKRPGGTRKFKDIRDGQMKIVAKKSIEEDQYSEDAHQDNGNEQGRGLQALQLCPNVPDDKSSFPLAMWVRTHVAIGTYA